MSTARVVTLVVGGCLVAVWLAASAGAWLVGRAGPATPAGSGVGGPPASSAGGAGPALLVVEGPGLGPVRRPGRNLFETRRPADPVGQPPRETAEFVVPPASLDPAPAPSVALIGVATAGAGDGAVRTAVMSGAGELWLAREGAVVAGRYRVERVGADEVDLRDTVLNTRHTLRLR